MFHTQKNLLISVSLILLLSSCGQKGPLFLAKKTTPPITSEKSVPADNSSQSDETQAPEEINNINAD